MRSKKFILWFDELGIGDVPLVGGKNASLGEMYRKLKKKGIIVPNGFAITAEAYRYFVARAGIDKEIRKELKNLNIHHVGDLIKKGERVRNLILKSKFPPLLDSEIRRAYRQLCTEYGPHTDVAVRSSATAEDLPDASFAGQQETFLNIRGENSLLLACKKCFASLFTNRAISYRTDKGFDHFKVYLSVGVQKMVRSDLASSGVMFTIDTESGFANVVFINAGYGLGENIVKGRINPDAFYVFKPTLKKGYNAIISKTLGSKKYKLIYTKNRWQPTKNVIVKERERRKFAITDKEILQLAKWAVVIEEHYKKPMDIEWAKDGKTGKLFIVQARPETVHSVKDKTILKEYVLKKRGRVITDGKSVGNKIGQGTANVILNARNIKNFRKGQVLVTDMTDPDWEPIMKIASAIVTNKGGRTCFSGDTPLLTNKGFMKFEDVYENYEDLYVPSLNRRTLKVEWKPILAAMKRKSHVIEVNVSQSGRMAGNTLRLTPDHKMLTFSKRTLITRKIHDILSKEELLLVAQRIPSLTESNLKEQYLAYLLGAISTDGHIYLSKTHGEVQFIQKPTKEKQKFISHVNACLQKSFNKSFKESKKKTSFGSIRGKPVRGEANAYRCYSKKIAQKLSMEQENLTETIISADESFVYNFLAGVIDGDGTYQKGRVNIYISNDNLLQATVIGFLRLGVVPQVTRNRTIYNVQIVEKLHDILSYTKRIKGTDSRKRFGTRFFSSKQILGDVIDKLNLKGRIKPYVLRNLLIDSEKIKKEVAPLCSEDLKEEISKILESDTRMQRVSFERNLGTADVYNITVQDNHNYIVFTDRFTPIIANNCHAAIISRELGIPCLVGTNNATRKIKTGQKITVSCAEGDDGYVYDKLLKFEIRKTDLKKLPKTRTKIMMNIGVPMQAFEQSFIPNDGVGLAREEFIINSYIKIHPKALINYDKIKDKKIKRQIDFLTVGYENKKEFFINKLAWGIARIGAAFYPKDVIVRTSDFKTNEYANLIGGKAYEPEEDNPMIGWRGASRYYSDYEDAFALECRALKKVRGELGLMNVKIMIPFCRTIEEGKKVLQVMKKYGLERGKNGLEVYVMCEIPSNVILGNEFAKIFDGFSIGTNDLTQLTLGLDRDSELVASIYDERNPAVKKMVAEIIRIARKNKKKIGICGQAPSDYPEFAQFLVKCRIDSISLNPDTVVRTTLKIAETERKLRKSGKNDVKGF